MQKKLLGEILVEMFGIGVQEIEKALKFQKEYGGRIGTILINSGIISEVQLLEALSAQLSIPLFKQYVKDRADIISFPEIGAVAPSWLLEQHIIPLQEDGDAYVFAVVDPMESFTLEALQNVLNGRDIRYVLCSEKDFREIAADYKKKYALSETVISYEMDEVEKLKDLASEAPIIKFVNTTISKAIDSRASDIHIEIFEDNCRIRFRIDGVLNDMEFLPLKMHPAITTRIKILAGLDIAEKRLPQDGRIDLKVASKDLDIRVATFPTIFGENVVMRLLEKTSIEFDLATLGFEKDNLGQFLKLIGNQFGLILITGPTGSGKTTTLYSTISKLNSKEKKIITIEDPVEYQIWGVNQIHVKPSIGLTFASALRSILRQDPDIILVGEIRDRETAEIAIHAALTGHLVLSTLHTNDAPSAITRLLDMGIQDFLINSALIGVLAQRLLRTICPKCRREETNISSDIRREFKLDEMVGKYGIGQANFRRGSGCDYCVGTGFRGRLGIFELMNYDDHLKRVLLQHHNYQKLKEEAERLGMRTLREDALLKLLKGTTTLDEVLRVT
jgi:type II secretory ATPase GspE/PulE/Tfp pilus assembly ATPase PilB-like protein